MFKNLPIFEWKDLHGKTLKIAIGEDSGVTTVVGVDEKGVYYLLNTVLGNTFNINSIVENTGK